MDRALKFRIPIVSGIPVSKAQERDPFNQNFVQNSMDRFGSTEKTGPPFEVDHFSRLDLLEFWLNGSRPRKTSFPDSGIRITLHGTKCNSIQYLHKTTLPSSLRPRKRDPTWQVP